MSGLQAFTIVAHLSVAICGGDQVPSALLEKAEAIASDVYRDIGVTIDWREECGGNESALEVDLIASDEIPGAPVADVTLGFAEPGASAATVLSDRVAKFAKRYGLKREVLLGYAMAHEVGHLLLPPHSHSLSGVMRATIDIDQAASKKLRFTREQGEFIIDRLEGVASAVATH